MRLWIRRAGAALAMVLALGQGVAAETLADTLIAAYRNSNLLERNRAVLRAADEDVAAAVSLLRPALTFDGDTTYSSLRFDQLQASLSLAAQLTVFDNGRNKLGIEIAKESVLASREALIGVEQEVFLAAVRAYVNVRLTQDIVRLREANVRLIGEELRAANNRFEAGDVTRTDVAQAEASLAAAQSNLIAAQGDLLVAREDFRLAVGRYPGNLSALPRAPATARNLDEARAVAARTHPSVRQAQRLSTVSDLAVSLSKARLGPTVTARASVGLDDTGADTRGASLTFSQTLYAGGQLSALFRQSMASRDQARATLLQTSAEVAQGVGQAWANLTVSGASVTAADNQIRASQTAFEGVREEARLGSRTTLDVLEAEQDLLTARTNRVSAAANRELGVYALLSAMGLLTADHLRLGIATYDPAAYYNAVKNAPATSAQGKKLDRIMEKIGR